jgi:hypothetical protein
MESAMGKTEMRTRTLQDFNEVDSLNRYRRNDESELPPLLVLSCCSLSFLTAAIDTAINAFLTFLN